MGQIRHKNAFLDIQNYHAVHTKSSGRRRGGGGSNINT